MERHRIFAPAFVYSAINALVLAACYQPPTTDALNGSDLHPPNYDATKLKDTGHSQQIWPAVDDFMNARIGPNEPGCAVGIARGGEIEYLKGYGKAEVGGASWGVGTAALVGSVSKTLTAAAIVVMHDQNLLALDDAVSDHLPVSNNAVGALELLEILDHSSGVGGNTQSAAFMPGWNPGTVAEACAADYNVFCLATSALVAAPAYAFSQYEANEVVANLGGSPAGQPEPGVYSNVGYSVLGAVVDAIASGGYEDWIWRHIGQYGTGLTGDNMLTLALAHSWRESGFPERAFGYELVDGAFVQSDFDDTGQLRKLEGWHGPSGGWSMTIGDLTRFALALNERGLVSGAELADMRAVATQPTGLQWTYGRGMFHGTPQTIQPTYWHGGDITGGHSAVWTYWPSFAGDSLSVNLICNRPDMISSNLQQFSWQIAQRLANTAPTPLVKTFGPADPRRTRGVYELDYRDAWHANQRAGGGRIFVPLNGLRETLALDVGSSGGELALDFVHGQRRERLDVAVSNPRFVSRPISTEVATAIGDVEISDFEISGVLTEDGRSIADVSLRGTIDARQIGPLIGRSAESMCDETRACQGCADGARACVDVEYRGLTGREAREGKRR